MANKKRRTKQQKKKDQWEKERATFLESQRIAPAMKAKLRAKGCDLPFYDYLDSYKTEFDRIVRLARLQHTSLMGVHEVDTATYSTLDSHWGDFGYGDLEQIFYDIGNENEDYLSQDADSNISGVARPC